MPPAARRIEIVAARTLAWVWGAWIGLLCVAMLCAVALPASMRIVLCATLATANLLSSGAFLGWSASRTVRALEWAEVGDLRISTGDRAPVPARVARGSFRCGRAFVVLWLVTCRGRHGVIILAREHPPALFRGLCRWLEAGFPRQAERSRIRTEAARRGQADTIRTKV